MNGTSAGPVTVTITTVDGTANGKTHYITAVQISCFETSGDDYGDPHPTMLEFEVGITTVCSSILTVDEETYEDSESFSVVLHSANESIVIAVSSATISITNDDRELETLQNVVSIKYLPCYWVYRSQSCLESNTICCG